MTQNPAAPDAPEPDDKDWTWVLDRSCSECGYDSASIARESVAARLLGATPRWQSALARKDATDRPAPQTWSVLEYGCHVRDVHRMFGERARLILTENDPEFANWDQDETALLQEYWKARPAEVAPEIVEAAVAAAETSPACRPGSGQGPDAGATVPPSPWKHLPSTTCTTSSIICTTSAPEQSGGSPWAT